MKEFFKNTFSMYRKNKMLVSFWFFALFVIIFINMTHDKTYSFYGIAGSDLVKVSSQYPVKIRSILVIPGQKIKKGEVLMELIRNDLELKEQEISDKLDIIQDKFQQNQKMMNIIKFSAKSNQFNNQVNPFALEIKKLQNQLNIINEEKKKLTIYSEIDGVIGDVFFHNGEEVSPFSTICSMSREKPNYIEAWIHEAAHNQVIVGDDVSIVSTTSDHRVIKGKVVTVGKRIVEFPLRMIKRANTKMWGRKVIILPESNNYFLLGEKIFVTVNKSSPSSINESDSDIFGDAIAGMIKRGEGEN